MKKECSRSREKNVNLILYDNIATVGLNTVRWQLRMCDALALIN